MPQLTWTGVADHEGRTVYSAPATLGKNFVCDNGITIRLSPHFNGSGEQAMNGSTMWPHVTLDVCFPEGAEKARAAFVMKLQKFIEQNL